MRSVSDTKLVIAKGQLDPSDIMESVWEVQLNRKAMEVKGGNPDLNANLLLQSICGTVWKQISRCQINLHKDVLSAIYSSYHIYL